MMTFTTTLTTANRKRSRPVRTATTLSMQLLALVVLLVLSQASAFHASSTTPSRSTPVPKTASIEDHWTLEDLQQMDAVYDRYVQAIVQKYGANWEEDYELVVNKVEIYEAYLQFEERKAREAEEAEERRLLTVASHKALLQLDQQQEQQQQQEDYSIETWEVESQNRTGEPSSLPSSLATAMDLPTRSHMFVLNTGSYFHHNNNHRKSTTATTTIVTAQGGTQSVIGSI